MYTGNVNYIRIQQNDQLAMEYARAKGTSVKEFAEKKGISYRKMGSLLRRRNMRSHLKSSCEARRGYTREQKDALVAEFEERKKSDPMLTQASFAAEKGICSSTFGNWTCFARKKREAMPMAVMEETEPKAVEVQEVKQRGQLAYRFESPTLSLECYRELALDEIEKIARILGSLGK